MNAAFSLFLLGTFSRHVKTRIGLPGFVCRHGQEKWLTCAEKQQVDKENRGFSRACVVQHVTL